MAKCPSHDDRKASLSITEGKEGRALLKCHAGCETKRIVSDLGLTLADLFPDGEKPTRGEKKRKIEAIYSYRDKDGKLCFEVVRYKPKGFTQRRPGSAGSRIYNLKDIPRILYRLPELLAANPKATVFIVEGEKDADRLHTIGLIATCNPGGARKWRSEYNAHLTGRDVVILPDNDTPGLQHAEMVARHLHGIAASLKIVQLSGLSEKGDVSDWLDNGGDAESLCIIAENAPEWTPTTDTDKDQDAGEASGIEAFHLGDFLSQEYPPSDPIIYELERGEFALLNAVTNVGKSTWLRNLSLKLACGEAFPPLLTAGKERRVMLIDFETRSRRLQCDLHTMMETLSPDRVEVAKRNLFVMCEAEINGEGLCLSLHEHLEAVTRIAKQAKADLLIIDTYGAGFAVFDENSNGETNRRVLRPLIHAAREINAAILLAHHIGKGASEEGRSPEAAYRGRGASALGAGAAVVINLTADPHDLNRVTLRIPKLKGKRLDDCILTLNQETRWFEATGIAASHTPTSYEIVLECFKDGQPHSRKEVVTTLAGQINSRTVERHLKDAVSRGDLRPSGRGFYAIPTFPTRYIGMSEMSESPKHKM